MGRRSCNEPVPLPEYKAEGCVIVRIFFRETKNADAHQLMDENYHLYVSKLMKNRILNTL